MSQLGISKSEIFSSLAYLIMVFASKVTKLRPEFQVKSERYQLLLSEKTFFDEIAIISKFG